ncbi:hypothetical protein [Anaerosinus massiliensis]|uniref:hypothetical protein n=1 Tax=Massilibacillus massiliensis TaxID=1806837 RepID=UPI000DA6051E|nr:hypothetical protein [Massilibacillus massiliensis]
MDDKMNTIEWKLIFSGVKEATQNVTKLRTELEKVGQTKIQGGISKELKEELTQAQSIANQKGQAINQALNSIGKQENTEITKFVDGYKKAISTLTTEAEKYNRLYNVTGNTAYQTQMNQRINQVRQLSAEYEKFNGSLIKSGLSTVF